MQIRCQCIKASKIIFAREAYRAKGKNAKRRKCGLNELKSDYFSDRILKERQGIYDMILHYKYFIIVYVICAVILLLLLLIAKSKETRRNVGRGFIVYGIVVIATLYYYRPLDSKDVLSRENYEYLFKSSATFEIEEKGTSFKDTDLVDYLKEVNFRHTSKRDKKINENFSEDKTKFVVKNNGDSIFSATIFGDFEYIYLYGDYYKIIKDDAKSD